MTDCGGQVETHLEHNVPGDQLVDGFERRGSYVQDFRYEANIKQVGDLFQKPFDIERKYKWCVSQ